MPKIILEKKDGVAKITLNRPNELNALDSELFLQLLDAMEDIEKDDSVRVVVFTGAGRAFCAGGDLKAQKALLDRPKELYEFVKLSRKVFDRIENLTKPTIAAVNGLALAGGFEIVECCDLAVAAEDAQIGDQHANYGLVGGICSVQRLPRLLGLRKAKELLLTGSRVSAKEAERLGLVNRVVPADKLEEAAMEMASSLVSKSPLASKLVKSLIHRAVDTDLSTALDIGVDAVFHHFGTDDLAEGIKAFEEKRQPEFKGK